MRKYNCILVSLFLAFATLFTACDIFGEEPDNKVPENNDGSGGNNSLPQNYNNFTANGTTYYYGEYSVNSGWSIGSGSINADYGYYTLQLDAFDSQLSPTQMEQYYSGTLTNINMVTLRLAIENFNPLMAKVGDALQLRRSGTDGTDDDFTSRFYFYFNNAKNQIRYSFGDDLKGNITFLSYENNVLGINLQNVYVYRTGTAPEDAPIQFVLNGKVYFLLH